MGQIWDFLCTESDLKNPQICPILGQSITEPKRTESDLKNPQIVQFEANLTQFVGKIYIPVFE